VGGIKGSRGARVATVSRGWRCAAILRAELNRIGVIRRDLTHPASKQSGRVGASLAQEGNKKKRRTE